MYNSLLVLRLLHITAGVFWAGAAIYTALFVLPAVRALGPDGGKFMRQLAVTNRFPMVMNIASSTTVISGIVLLWILSGGFKINWVLSLHGIVLTAGGVAAICAYLIGYTINRPTVSKIGALNRQIAASNGMPTQEQKETLQRYSSLLFKSTTFIAALLIASVIAMSIIRYI